LITHPNYIQQSQFYPNLEHVWYNVNFYVGCWGPSTTLLNSDLRPPAAKNMGEVTQLWNRWTSNVIASS